MASRCAYSPPFWGSPHRISPSDWSWGEVGRGGQPSLILRRKQSRRRRDLRFSISDPSGSAGSGARLELRSLAAPWFFKLPTAADIRAGANVGTTWAPSDWGPLYATANTVNYTF